MHLSQLKVLRTSSTRAYVISKTSSAARIFVFVTLLAVLAGIGVLQTASIASVAPSVDTSSTLLSWEVQAAYPAAVQSFNGISCSSASNCLSVGSSITGDVLAYSTTTGGQAWSNDSRQLPSLSGALKAASCISSTFCVAVGSSGTILSYNGSTWSEQSAPSGVNSLSGVSCTSSSFCVAVGNDDTLSYNGSTWSLQPNPYYTTSPSVGVSFNAVSCVSQSFCDAVGSGTTNLGETYQAFAIVYDGSSWSTQQLPTQAYDLTNVSCTSEINCEATGTNNSKSPLSIAWDGTSWTAQNIPSSILHINATTCVSPTTCEALGDTSSQVVILTLAPYPVITSITPSSAPVTGGETVTVAGNGFIPGATVSFGSNVLTSSAITVNSSTQISVIVPPVSTPGYIKVTVTTPAGTSQGAGFVYITPDMSYTPVYPFRIADTRCSQSPQPSFCSEEHLPIANASLAPPSAGGSITLQVTGTGSETDTIPANAEAVVATVTAITNAQAISGYLTVYPAGTNPPTASSLNYIPNDVVPNLVTATMGESGAIEILSSGANTNIVVDVMGYYAPKSSTFGSADTFSPLSTPVRVLDTRCAMNTPPSYCSGEHIPSVNNVPAPGGGKVISIQVTGVDNVSADATAVSMVLTAASPTDSGYITVFPASSDASPPETSNVNFKAGSTTADSVIVPVGTGGFISIYNYSATPTNVVVDINGWFSPSSSGDTFTPSSPVRICDTRALTPTDTTIGVTGMCANSGTPLGHSAPISVLVDGIGGVPQNASGIVMNATVVDGTSGGYLTIWSAGNSQPSTSNLNWASNQIEANFVISGVSSSGRVEAYASSTVNLVLDISGWYTG